MSSQSPFGTWRATRSTIFAETLRWFSASFPTFWFALVAEKMMSQTFGCQIAFGEDMPHEDASDTISSSAEDRAYKADGS